jgi:CRP-like cAMP-binding protein
MGFYGDLEDLPLQDILYVITSHGKSGILTLQTRSHDLTLEFDRARIASVRTGDGSLRIGHLLVAQGYVTQEQIEQALGLQSVSPDSARIGDLLVDVGYVTREQIQEAVNAQLEASVFRILVQRGGRFQFRPTDSVVADPIATGIRLEAMVLNAMRLADEWRTVHDPDDELSLADDLIDSSQLSELEDAQRQIVMAILNGDTTIDLLALRAGLTASAFSSALGKLQESGIIRTKNRTETTSNGSPKPEATYRIE